MADVVETSPPAAHRHQLDPNPSNSSSTTFTDRTTSDQRRTMARRPIRIMCGTSNPELFEKVASHLGKHPVGVKVSHFANSETSVQVHESVRDTDVFVLQSGCGPVNDALMETLIILSTCRTSSARRIIAVLPFFPYSKQSKQKKRGTVPAKLVADLIKVAGATQVITMDLHHMQMQGFFGIPIENVKVSPLIISYIKNKVDGWKQAVIVAKNAGASKRAALIAKRLNIDFAMIFGEQTNFAESLSEERLGEDGSAEAADNEAADIEEDAEESASGDRLIGSVEGRIAIVVDDIIDTGDPFVKASELLYRQRASRVFVMATHGVFSGKALENLKNAGVERVVVTNTIPQEKNKDKYPILDIIDCSHILAESVRRVYNHESLAAMYTTGDEHSLPLTTKIDE